MTETDASDPSLPPAVKTVPADPEHTLIEPVAWQRPDRAADPDRPPQMIAHPELQPPGRRRGGGVLIILLLVVLVGGGAAAAWYVLKPGHALPNSASLTLPKFTLPNIKLPTLPFLGGPKPAPVVAASAAPAQVVVERAPGSTAASAASSQLAIASAAPVSEAPSAAASAMAAAASAAPPQPSIQPVQQAAAGLVADARRSGLPSEQVAALAAANNKLGVAATGAAPGAPQAAALAMARGEAAALGRVAAARTREVDGMLGQAAVGDDAVDALQRANAALTHWTSVAQSSRDPMTAITAARRAVAAYAAFNTAYLAATHYYAPAKRSDFWAVAGQSRETANRVIQLAANAKAGGLFATEGRRQAYEQMQDNAGRADHYLNEISRLSQAERGEGDLRRLDLNYQAIVAVKQAVQSLYATSDTLYRANK